MHRQTKIRRSRLESEKRSQRFKYGKTTSPHLLQLIVDVGA
jgi:hypothetical protein